ncbi:MAG: polymer-forming cytoskeletal protein [Thalassobaculaceae bacterium]|nr:polymer-forming cytoskeletal protein [Thalassobaculaceae bacterium]
MFRRRRASETPRDDSVGPASGAGGSHGAESGVDSGAEISPIGSLSEHADRVSGSPASGASGPDGLTASPSSAASDSKGSAMSASTPPRTPGQGFVPEIPRRSAADIPGAPTRRPAIGRGNEESKRLLVGKDISLSGEITACDSLVVEGTVQATLEHSQSLEVTDTGLYKGKVTIEEAIIAGRFEGELSVRGTLSIKSTGVLEGKVRFHKLEVELGGVIKGDVGPLTEE